MSEVDLEKVRERHGPNDRRRHYCRRDGEPDPCDAIQLAEELESYRVRIKDGWVPLLDVQPAMEKAEAAQKEEITRLQEQERTSSTALLKQIEVNAGLREALEFYGYDENWRVITGTGGVISASARALLDRGKIARAALNEKP
jgi:hypothetical protein